MAPIRTARVKLPSTIAVAGMGLIGGSFALGIKRAFPRIRVMGISRHRANIKEALRIKAIDEGSTDLAGAASAGLIMLAVPPGAVIEMGKRLSMVISPETVVMDAGSAKADIVKELTRHIRLFVGAHPLAGSEKSGISNAHAGLFLNSVCILTPISSTIPGALSLAAAIWKRLGARIVSMPPLEHDLALARTSHLPHLLAFALMNTAHDAGRSLFPRSFLDMTRIARSDPRLWSDIFLHNKKPLLQALRSFRGSMDEISSALESGKTETLEQALKRASREREKLP